MKFKFKLAGQCLVNLFNRRAIAYWWVSNYWKDADILLYIILFWKSAQKKDEASQMSSQKDGSASQKSDNTSQKKLGASQRAVMEMIDETPNVTTSEIAERIGIDRRNVQEHIKKLQESGLLHREGGRKNGKWIIDYGVSSYSQLAAMSNSAQLIN